MSVNLAWKSALWKKKQKIPTHQGAFHQLRQIMHKWGKNSQPLRLPMVWSISAFEVIQRTEVTAHQGVPTTTADATQVVP